MNAAVYAGKAPNKRASPTNSVPSPDRSSMPWRTRVARGGIVSESHVFIDDGISSGGHSSDRLRTHPNPSARYPIATRDSFTHQGCNDARTRKRLYLKVLELVDQNIASWNQIAPWLKRLDALRVAA